ncbi:MAG: NAD(P)-dependent oxidoreductase [Spirochaetes bacterium]|nr:MAG: NAD(P)-dependent oxidoreductase [Spirochaetota bacterium]
MDLANKTLLITGSSRGIGLAIALRAARDGANIVVVGKTAEPNPKLPGTVYDAVREIERAGGKAVAAICDIRYEDQVRAAVDAGVKAFGGIDIVVNNASAISLTRIGDTEMKRFDLMFAVNVRGTFMTTKIALPYLRKSANPHVLVLSPPLAMDGRWFQNNLAYTMSKYGMSMCVLGLARELADDSIAVNALWPRTAIATAAVQNLLGGDEMMRHSRTPEIVADAAWYVLTSPARETTGNFYIDDEVLMANGICDLTPYAVDPGAPLARDFFLHGEGDVENYCEDI